MFGQERLGEDRRFEKEEKMAVEEAAAELEKMAEALRKYGELTLTNNNEQITVSPSNEVQVTVDYVKKGKHHKSGFYFEWYT
ncbi:amphi-Trp domain-containing protein [Alteribacillus persepolensis]|nr:amphi-Trp domain-containing protein [Alteribacillus persepolensis]